MNTSLVEQLHAFMVSVARDHGIAWEERPVPEVEHDVSAALARERARAAVAIREREERAMALCAAAHTKLALQELTLADVERYLTLKGWTHTSGAEWKKSVVDVGGGRRRANVRTLHLSPVAGGPVLLPSALTILSEVECGAELAILADLVALRWAAERHPSLVLVTSSVEEGGAPCS